MAENLKYFECQTIIKPLAGTRVAVKCLTMWRMSSQTIIISVLLIYGWITYFGGVFWALRRMTAESAIFCTKIMTFQYKLYCIRFGNVPQLETSDFNQSWSQPGTSTFLAKRVWVLDNHEVNLCEASLSPLTQTSHPLIKKWSCEMHCWQRWQMIIANLRRHFKLPRDQQWPLDTLANRANLTTFHMLWCTMCLTTALCDSVCSSAVFSFVLSGDLLRAFPVLKTWGLGVKHHLWSFGVL